MSYIRQANGFVRYAIAVQYHGGPFLGFSIQRNQEDSILSDGTDLRGLRTVEGRLLEALGTLVGEGNFENFRVSSRTDRGVHAIKNTCHVDIRPRKITADPWEPSSLHHGVNFYLARQSTPDPTMDFMNQLRIVAVKNVPRSMKNVFYDGSERNGPATLDWHARFSATERTYVYRILHSGESSALPFEWDRAWNVHHRNLLKVDAMNEAARHLVGTHDVTSFRGSNCGRDSPIVTMKDVSISSQPYGISAGLGISKCMIGSSIEEQPNLILIKIVGKSFVYRQVRNIVGCLLEVGREKRSPDYVKQVLGARDRKKAPAMAPPHGLFLVDVKHGNFRI